LEKIVFYVHYEGVLNRNRFRLILLNPFVVLSLFPILACSLFQVSHLILVKIAIINVMLSYGDLLGFFNICVIHINALIRNTGWKSYWKKQ